MGITVLKIAAEDILNFFYFYLSKKISLVFCVNPLHRRGFL